MRGDGWVGRSGGRATRLDVHNFSLRKYNGNGESEKQIVTTGTLKHKTKPRPLWGRGSVEVVDAPKVDLFLSIQRCTQARLTRSLPVIAGVGKVAGLKRLRFHPEIETTPEGIGLQVINRFP
jgi:hypothetical protein